MRRTCWIPGWAFLLAAALLGAGRADAAPRIVAIGDLHGDLSAARQALRLAGAIDEDDRWAGGALVVVQLGDILDRSGGAEQAILDLFERLRGEAARAGGAVQVLNGNHEFLNVEHDFRYVTDEGFADFADDPALARAGPQEDSHGEALPPEQWSRAAAFAPGGPYARLLANHPVVLLRDGVIFVHGGLRPRYARYGVARLNEEASAWLRGEGPQPEWVAASKGPLWSRDFSDEVDEDDCLLLERTLALLNARAMVVAHSVHDSITAYCDGRLWCIDTGMSEAYGGEPAVLEITTAGFRALTAD